MEETRKIAVLGGGHGAHAMAADLTHKGHTVNLCEAPEFEKGFRTTLERQAIDLIDAWGERHTVELNRVTTDFKEALKGVKYIMLAIPAVGSRRFLDAIKAHLEDGQTIIKWSGNFSALSFASMLKKEGIKKQITIAESHTLPWGCRLVAPGTVQIMVWAVKLLFAAIPAKHTDRVMKEVGKMYPLTAGENVLATTLNNLNPIVHPVGTLMNAGWVDTAGENFYLYRDGNTISTARGVKKVFEEVSDVAGAVGLTMLEYPEEDFWKKSSIMGTHFRAAFDKEGVVAKISGPSSLKSRYITEDLPYGLVPIKKLANQYNISTPMIDAVIEFASVANQTDYMTAGLSLEELGIAGLDRDELWQLLDEGFE
jgi:opine dehydrogenase